MQMMNQLGKMRVESNVPQQRSMGLQGGYGSSSLKECIELLNATARSAPAPLDSGVGQKSTDPSQLFLLPCPNCKKAKLLLFRESPVIKRGFFNNRFWGLRVGSGHLKFKVSRA